jgi:asparagine synthase (glutamine-hydrolysing)
MCGIAGMFLGGNTRVDERELGRMTDALAHRGPDDRTLFVAGPAGLGFRRLAIIDPAGGRQPLYNEARDIVVIMNGELYNFRELRAELEQRGERFESDCDTEVLLRLFALDGPAMLEWLNGIFAFAVWDDREKRLFLARDRLGVKPLYHTARPGLFAFASELRTLLPLLDRVELDETALADYLIFLWVPDPKTAFRGIAKLPPGHYA